MNWSPLFNSSITIARHFNSYTLLRIIVITLAPNPLSQLALTG